MMIRTLSALLVATGLAVACAEERKSEPLVGSIDLSPREQRGRDHFMRFCNECHPSGEAGLGPSLNDKLVPAAAIRAQVRNGFGEMPAFGDEHLPDGELDEIIAFLEALREHGE